MIPIKRSAEIVTVTTESSDSAITMMSLLEFGNFYITSLTFSMSGKAVPANPQHTDMYCYETEQIVEIISDNWQQGMLVQMKFQKG